MKSICHISLFPRLKVKFFYYFKDFVVSFAIFSVAFAGYSLHQPKLATMESSPTNEANILSDLNITRYFMARS